jgi:hypothetical protein
MPPVLHDGNQRVCGRLGIREGLAATTMAVDVDQAGQNEAVPMLG